MLKYELGRIRPIVAFFFLAFTISWSGGLLLVAASHQFFTLHTSIRPLLLVLFAIGPTVGAVVVQRITCSNPNEPKLLKSLLPARQPWQLFAFALFFPFALIVPINLIDNLCLCGQVPDFAPQRFGAVMSSLLLSCLANPCEEIGWRGYALPRLQNLLGTNTAALLIGVVTGIWHLPLFWMAGGSMSLFPFHFWILGSIATSFSLTWVYNRTGGSLFFTSLLHISLNTWFNIFGIWSFQSYAAVSVVSIVAFIFAHQRSQTTDPDHD
jgi:membrane protease YdiL (CAAX protease family)